MLDLFVAVSFVITLRKQESQTISQIIQIWVEQKPSESCMPTDTSYDTTMLLVSYQFINARVICNQVGD